MNYKVIIGLRSWSLGGVEVFSNNLARGLVRKGIPVRILITGHHDPEPYSLPYPEDISVDRLPVHQKDTWRDRWRTMIRYLEGHSPCIYIPNNDSAYSCVSSKLPESVLVVGILHSDEFFHYEHVMRMGRYWNGIVAVSNAIAGQTEFLERRTAKRMVTIPCGVTIPEENPHCTPKADAPLRIIYAGRLIQHQKRVLDLHGILAKLVDAEIPVELTIIGDGAQRLELENACEKFISSGIMRVLGIFPNVEVLKAFENQDVILLTSDFEGMPVCVLEAMGRGCIPVVTDIRSGIPELIKDDWNGYIICHNDLETFAQRIGRLKNDMGKRQSMSLNAYETIRQNYQLEFMIDSYIRLFERIHSESENGFYKRPSGPILPPAGWEITWKEKLPTPVRSAGLFGKRVFRETRKLFDQKMSYARNLLNIGD